VEAERGREAEREMAALAEFPVELSVGEQRISVPKPSLAKILLFQKTYQALLQKSVEFSKPMAAPVGDDIGQMLVSLAALEGAVFEFVVLMARIIIEPNQKGISASSLTVPAEQIMEADEDQLIAILNLGFGSMRFDRVKKNLNLSP